MSTALLTLAALACPIAMGFMMWRMMRGYRADSSPDAPTGSAEARIARLQTEIDQLRAAESGKERDKSEN